jgi:ornithine cyclodeaminase/alanine dehydrogenase-like protein (mu-crystallin family)
VPVTSPLGGLPLIDAGRIAAAASRPALTGLIRAAYLDGQHEAALTPARLTAVTRDPYRVFGAMPSVSTGLGLFVTKLATLAQRRESGAATVQALVVAMSARTGEPLAVLDGAALTDLKCAAVTALVTDVCAAPDATTAGLVGTGALAFAQLLGLTDVRRLTTITVYGRDPGRAAAFARRAADALPGGPELRLAGDLAEFAGHDIVGTATTSDQPLLPGARPAPGLHVNCMGAHTTVSRELDRPFLAGCELIVEDRATALAEAGPEHERALDLAALLRADPGPLRRAATVFSSTGHAFLDLVTTAHVLDALGLYPLPTAAPAAGTR